MHETSFKVKHIPDCVLVPPLPVYSKFKFEQGGMLVYDIKASLHKPHEISAKTPSALPTPNPHRVVLTSCGTNPTFPHQTHQGWS